MAVTLSKIMQRVWRETGWSQDILATGGSTTTIIDTNTIYTTTNALAGGTAIVVRDAAGAGAAPEGEVSRIASFDVATKTFTLTSTLTAAVAAGDSILLATPKVKLAQMIQAVNDGLTNLGTISLVDTSLATVAAQREYALPVGLKIKRVLDVLMQTKLNDSDDNRYMSIFGNIRFFPAAPGSTGIIETMGDYPAGRTLKIVYEGTHPTLNAFRDKVSETIQEELAVAAAMDKVLTWLVSKRGDSALGTFVIQRWNDAKQTLQAQKADKPIHHAKPKAKWFVANPVYSQDDFDSDPGGHWTNH
jgi:hypothetical protein